MGIDIIPGSRCGVTSVTESWPLGASGQKSPLASAKAVGSAFRGRVFMASADAVLESGARVGTALLPLQSAQVPTKRIPISEIRRAPIRHERLPAAVIARIRDL